MDGNEVLSLEGPQFYPLNLILLSPAQPMSQADQREAGVSAITAAAKGSLTTQPSISIP